MSTKDLTEALAALTEQSRSAPRERMEPRGAVGQAKASALLPGGAPAGGGSAANMTETAYSDRTWHTPVFMPSSDGIFFGRLVPVKTVKFTDPAGNQVVYEFKAPS